MSLRPSFDAGDDHAMKTRTTWALLGRTMTTPTGWRWWVPGRARRRAGVAPTACSMRALWAPGDCQLRLSWPVVCRIHSRLPNAALALFLAPGQPRGYRPRSHRRHWLSCLSSAGLHYVLGGGFAEDLGDVVGSIGCSDAAVSENPLDDVEQLDWPLVVGAAFVAVSVGSTRDQVATGALVVADERADVADLRMDPVGLIPKDYGLSVAVGFDVVGVVVAIGLRRAGGRHEKA